MKQKTKTQKTAAFIILIFITWGLFALMTPVQAEEKIQECGLGAKHEGWCLEIAIPGAEQKPIKSPSEYIRLLFVFGMRLAAILAVAVLVYAGFLWMTSPSISSIENAKGYIWGAIGGIILLLASYLILKTINPDLVKLKEPRLNSSQEKSASPGSLTCENCIPAEDKGISVSGEAKENNNESSAVTQEIINHLVKVQAECQKITDCGFDMTAGFDLDGHSANSCHKTGQAADIVPNTKDKSAADYGKLRTAITNSGAPYIEEGKDTNSWHFHIGRISADECPISS